MKLLFLLPLATALPALAQQPTPSDSTATSEVQLESALVVGARQQKVQTSIMGLNYLRPEQIKSIPTLMGEADIVKALQMQPGVSSGVDGFAGLMVRGGNNDQNIFLIDGNPIYQMNHAGGFFSAYNIEAVRDVAFYKGSFPARYGGRLSSVVDIETRTGNVERISGSLMVGLTSANLSIGGPILKDRTSFQVALRRSWMDIVTRPAIAIANSNTRKEGNKMDAVYSFTDFNLRLNHRLGRWGTLSLLGYYGQDKLRGSYIDWNVNSKTPEDEWSSDFESRLRWGNLLTALRWQMPLRERLLQSLTVAYTRYHSMFGFSSEDVAGKKGTANYERSYHSKDVNNGIDDVSLRSQWLWTPHWGTNVRFGLDYTYHHFTPETAKETSDNQAIRFITPAQALNAHELAAYIDADYRATPWLNLNAGLRLSDFKVPSKNYLQLEPRLSVNVVLAPSWSLKAAYARMSQSVQQMSKTYIALPTDYWMPISAQHAPLTSDQWSVGAYYSLHNRWNFSIEGWYKKMNNLLEYREQADNLSQAASWADKLTQGTGEAYGIDVQVEKNYGRLAGFVGYGLLFTDRHFAELNRGQSFPSKYDNRHKFNIALSYRASRRMEINAAWTVMTGNLITLSFEDYNYARPDDQSIVPPYPSHRDDNTLHYFQARNNFRLPTYHRIDVGINFYRFHKKRGRQSIWNISAYNAYSRMNPIVVRKRYSLDSQQPARYETMALFPIIPSVSYTYKF